MNKINEFQRQLLMERSIPGRIGSILPDLDVPEQKLPRPELLRDNLDFPELIQPCQTPKITAAFGGQNTYF